MTALSDDFWTSAKAPGSGNGVRLRNASWGFALVETAGRADLAERVLKLTGLGLFPLAGALLAFSGLVAMPLGLTGQLGTLVAFILVGVGVYAYAARGLRRALQVDTTHAVFRLGSENARGSFTETGKHRFQTVQSIFLMRENAGAATAMLHLRLKGSSQPVFVLAGPERTLVPVLERITESVRRKNGARRTRTKTTGRFVHVSFS